MSARGIVAVVMASVLASASALAACGAFDAEPSAPELAPDGGGAGGMSADAASDAPPGIPPAPDAGREGGAPPGTVLIDAAGSGSFYIDAHEVTFGEYAAFIDAIKAGTVTPSKPARCSTKTTFAPLTSCTSAAAVSLEHPVACVDWCDAFAYCAFRGERLCGKIGGGPVDTSFPATAQWGVACAGPSGMAYPYGSTADDSACWTRGDAGTFPSPVAMKSTCVGSVPGLFDMSGNVWEWQDQCTSLDGAPDLCIIRGGSVADFATSASCSAEQSHVVETQTYNIGFRCCADP